MSSAAERIDRHPVEPFADAGPPVLALRSISMRWPRAPQMVLDDVDLVLPSGTLTWVAGRNGAGKTTMLRIAAALIKPTAGTVRLRDIDPELQRREFHRRVGFLSAASAGLYARMTPRQHLNYWGRLALMDRTTRAQAVEATIEQFALESFADRRSDRVSMGQRQRIRLAMTFIHTPELLLLDEPRNSLDEEGVAILVEAIRRTIDAGGAAIWCSPTGEPPEVDVHRTLRIDGGKIRDA